LEPQDQEVHREKKESVVHLEKWDPLDPQDLQESHLDMTQPPCLPCLAKEHPRVLIHLVLMSQCECLVLICPMMKRKTL